MNEEKFTKVELECNAETMKHIELVRKLLRFCENWLRDEGVEHDQTKMKRPEVEVFAANTPNLKGLTYSADPKSDYQKQCKAEMGVALTHHYAKNVHHPQHFKNGINDMHILHLVAMLADWKASSTRHDDGNLLHSIEENAERFGIQKQLVKIMVNTAKFFEEVKI